MRHRLFDRDSIAQGVHTIASIREKLYPQGFPLAPAPEPTKTEKEEEQPEIHQGYCLKCKDKKSFQVEGEDKMPNGTIRKHGKCLEPGCSTTISAIVSGKAGAGGFN